VEVFDVRVGGGGCLGFYRERFGWKLVVDVSLGIPSRRTVG
jgi:hypothetical protein